MRKDRQPTRACSPHARCWCHSGAQGYGTCQDREVAQMGPRFESRQTLCCDTAGQEDYTVALTTHGDNRRPAAWSRVVKGPPSFLPAGHRGRLCAAVKKIFRRGRWHCWCPRRRMTTVTEIRDCEPSTIPGIFKTPDVPGYLRPFARPSLNDRAAQDLMSRVHR